MTPVQIARPKHFSERESCLFAAWMETLNATSRREGPLHFERDAMPILVMLTHEHFPKIGRRRAATIGKKLVNFFVQAEKTLQSPTVGRA